MLDNQKQVDTKGINFTSSGIVFQLIMGVFGTVIAFVFWWLQMQTAELGFVRALMELGMKLFGGTAIGMFLLAGYYSISKFLQLLRK